MAMVHWVLDDGKRISADISPGTNLMEAALAHQVPHVVGECGGCLSCATCHVVVDEAWASACPSVSEVEDAMLEIVTTPRQPTSRLSCQLIAGPGLDGVVLHVPAD